MTIHESTRLRLRLTVRQGVTVLPRCLQILSRRGFTLTGLTTEPHSDGTATIALTAEGNARWHDAVPQLLSRLVDVVAVAVESENRHV